MYCVCLGVVCVLIPLGGIALAGALFLSGSTKTVLGATSLAGIHHYVPRELRGRMMTI